MDDPRRHYDQPDTEPQSPAQRVAGWRLFKNGPPPELAPTRRNEPRMVDLMKYVHHQDTLDWKASIAANPEYRWRTWMTAPSVPSVSDGPARLGSCTTGLMLLSRKCGHNQVVPIGCGLPTCPECERRRSQKVIARWSPTFAKMKHPKMLVLAMKSSAVLIRGREILAKCYDRFQNLRLGRVARRRLKQATLDLIEELRPQLDANHNADQKRFSADKFIRSCNRFWDVDVPQLERAKIARVLAAEESPTKNKLAMKVRDLFYGVRGLEVTENIFSGWHPHYHIAFDGPFIPWPAVMALWQRACTVNGECLAALADPDEKLEPGQVLGRTAHISALRDIREVLKYVTKHQDYKHPGAEHEALPGEKRTELIEGLHGVKRIRPLGGARPAAEEPAPCPGCDDTECKCHKGETLRTYLGGDIWRSSDGERLYQIERRPDVGLVWRGLAAEPPPLLDTLGDWRTQPLPLQDTNTPPP